jgi:16S rRNA (uracil1498-N3)-methyltransferase
METPANVDSVAHLLVDDPLSPTLGRDNFHHVARVLRARAGELVTVTNGAGSWVTYAVPDKWDDPSIPLRSTGEPHHVPPRPMITVGVSLVKHDKPETVVQKLTEAGVDRIVFLAAAHSVVKWEADRAARHLDRLRAVAREALGQSRGVWLPTIEGPLTPGALWRAEQHAGRSVAAAHMTGNPFWASSATTLLIGPEGGWSDLELEQFGSETVRFGENVLRAETAAVAAGVLLTARRGGFLAE